MRHFVTAALLALMLLAGVPGARAQISIGIRIGPPPRPHRVHVLPPRLGPDFVWVEGYWYPVGRHYRWHEGYWTRPPYEGAYWVPPHYDGGEFFIGYWDGDHGRVEHDHHWDHDRERDFRGHDRDHGHGHDHDHGHK
jgi:WXXGXW repeat (2 copies)